MKPLSPLSRMSRMTASMTRPVVSLINLVKTIRLLTAFSIAILLGAPLTFGQEEPPQEALSTPEQARDATAARAARASSLHHGFNGSLPTRTAALLESQLHPSPKGARPSLAGRPRPGRRALLGGLLPLCPKALSGLVGGVPPELRSGPGFRPARDLSSAISSGRSVDGRTTPFRRDGRETPGEIAANVRGLGPR